MRALLLLVAGLAASLLVGACRPAASRPGSAGREPAPRRSEREGYRPPSDGVLTPGQVEAFLRVRQETARTRSSPRANAPLEGEEGISGAADARAAEIRAARAVSMPVEEYLWVKERVLEAEAALLTAKLNADVLALVGRTLASLRERRAAAPDEASRLVLDEQIAAFEAEGARVKGEAAEVEPAAVRANLAVLAPHRRRLDAIADELLDLRVAATPAPAPAKR